MKKLSKSLAMYICMFVAVFYAMTLKTEAANITTGTLGDNDGITWTYDADTKTLTITGEDSGLAGGLDGYMQTSPFKEICERVETIIVKDCTLKGSAYALFANLWYLERIEFYNFDTTEITDMSHMFSRDPHLTDLDLSSFDTGNVTTMGSMFQYCDGLTDLDLSGFNTGNVTSMSSMFSGCENLYNVNLSNFNTEKVVSIQSMFRDCNKLSTLDLSSFNTSNVKEMSYLFYSCNSLSGVDLSNFNTAQVTGMTSVFDGCSNLSSLNISNFNTANATSMQAMFRGCEKLSNLDVSKFDTSKVTFFYGMFDGCSSLTSLDLSSFNFAKSQNHRTFLDDCDNLAIIHTPKAFNSNTSLQLPAEYVDLNKTRTNYITKDFCNTTLVNVNYLVSEITLNESPFYISMGKNGQLSVASIPEKAILQTITWKSANTAVATVDASGKVTAVAPGTATITATATDLVGGSASASCEVIVTQPVTGIGLNKTSLNLEIGGRYALTATVSPDNATNKAVTWKSSNTAVATVDANGKVTAVSAGTATITVTTADGSGKSASCSVTVTPAMSEQERQVRAFVERMYTVVLGRASDPSGIAYWTEELLSHRKDGASISAGFIMSEEFVSRNYNNEAYLKVLYKTFFDREPDTGGMNFWLEQMKAGRSRKSVLAGFVNSKEFTEICESYGITRGTMEDDATATGAGQFVERLYTIALERSSDPAGLKDWADRINSRTNTPEQVAKEFFLSPEYTAKKTSNDKYVETLYLVFMDRASESTGKAYWVEQLNGGMSREAVLEGFAQSEEFKEIMARYGL